jgi:CheY-like chemotaxis protein
MRILIAEDDPIAREILIATLSQWDHELIVCNDGAEAWQALQHPDAPKLFSRGGRP